MPLRLPAWRHILAVALVAGLPLMGFSQSDEEKARSELRDLQRDIAKIQRDISSATTRRDKLQRQLKTAEVELGELQREASRTQQAIRDGKNELASLEQQLADLEKSRDQQKARIATELKAAWQMGQEGQVKVLLNQESPHTVARVMGYYRYFFQARHEILEAYRETLRELQALEERIDVSLSRLAEQRETLQTQQTRLTSAQGNREEALAQLNASIDSTSSQLKQKQSDRKELESLMRAIEETVDRLELPSNYQAFKSARGNMPWPLKGKASNRFGRPRNEGKMRWQGITIPAKEGATVRAIHHGRVVYADWLRGSGLLLIIDHGDSYMSLYAHNQSLLKDVGEWVSAGTPISTVGSTGGQERNALYFEVRHNGVPADPAKWCKG